MARPLVPDLRRLPLAALSAFAADRCPAQAAAIAYHVLLSLFPLALVAAGLAGMVADQDAIGRSLGAAVLGPLGIEGDAREGVEASLGRAVAGLGGLGLVGLVAMVWSASAMMGALRAGVEHALGVSRRRPYLRAKLMDLAFAITLGLCLGASVLGTLALRSAGRPAAGVMAVAEALVPPLVAFVAFCACYWLLPAVRPRPGAVALGAGVACVLFEALKGGFALWTAHLARYDVVYGSLGAIVAFMVFVFVAAMVMLLGAEVTAQWPRVRAGDDDGADDAGARERVRALARQLVFGDDR